MEPTVRAFYILLRCRLCAREITAEYYADEEWQVEDRRKGYLLATCQNCAEGGYDNA